MLKEFLEFFPFVFSCFKNFPTGRDAVKNACNSLATMRRRK
jgi:hypothetical protein